MRLLLIGAGDFAIFYANWFKQKGFDVTITSRDHEKAEQRAKLIGVNYERDIEKAILNNEVCVFCVSAKAMPEVIDKCSNYINKEHVALELCSVKSHVINSMRNLKAKEIISLHPMHGPSVDNLENIPVLAIPIRKGTFYEKLKNLFVNDKAQFYEIRDEKEHDRLVAYIQGFVHFYSLAGHLFIKPEIKELETYGSTNFELFWNVTSRIALQNPKLYAELQLLNPYVKEIKEKFLLQAADISNNTDKYFENLLNDENYSYYKDLFIKRTKKAVNSIMEHVCLSIACLGPEGSFSSIAANKLLKYFKGPKRIIYVKSLSDMFNVNAHAYVLPVENSITGSVNESLDFVEQTKKNIILEIILQIDHALVALKDHGKIKRIYSHEQALFQCSKFIKEHFPDAILVKVSSTSYALNLLLKSKDRFSAAIGNKEHAYSLGLEVLADKIQNNKNNMTRFWVVGDIKDKLIEKGKKYKSTILIEEAKDRPGFLKDVLDIFAKRKINLTNLSSRPSGKMLGTYKFFIDVEANIEGIINEIEQELKGEATLKLFGSYPVFEVEHES